MTTAVLGAGAMGSVYGGRLAEVGEDVVLVDISMSLVERLVAEGLILVDDGTERRIRVRATSNPGSVGPVDQLLVFVKGYQTEEAMRFAEPLVDDGTVAVTMQNGWGNGDVLARYVAPERVGVGISYHSALLLEPGRVAHTNSGVSVIGPLTGDRVEVVADVVDALRAAGLVDVTADIRRVVWKKLVLNSAVVPIAALTRLLAGQLRDEPSWSLVANLARETVAVGQAHGFELDLEEQLTSIDKVLEGNAAGKASMLQDVEAGRRTEIETINGAVVRLAAEHGVDVPLNSAMLTLVREHERATGLR